LAKYVLVSDLTLMFNYHDFPLLDFLPCAPSSSIPGAIYNFLKGDIAEPLEDGQARLAPYPVRKLEASLLRCCSPRDVVVPHPDFIEAFIKEDTEVIGVSTMDPLGLGPLTMSYSVLFGSSSYPWVRVEWEALIGRLNRARRGTRAKLVVGGPGVWEFTVFPAELERLGIDYAYQGEVEDVACLLFSQAFEDEFDANIFFRGFMSFDMNFRSSYRPHERFVSRRPGGKRYPRLEEIPGIVRPAAKALNEVMRGCGIGCDFCEVTLRPLRYYSFEQIAKEVEVNVRYGGFRNAWLQTDEFFAYQHGPLYTPNEEALTGLLKAVMDVGGVGSTNPTHARISPPAAYPELIRKLSEIVHAGPSNWIGVQVGVETGSDRLAKLHMPNKTLPLRIGSDGSWSDIVWEGTRNLNAYWWRPAFTVQVGQDEEQPEDNWETVALINRLSNSEVNGRSFEFTVTPMQHVPLGVLKSYAFGTHTLDLSQLAVYYASYRHLAKMAARNSFSEGKGNLISKLGTSVLIYFGGRVMMKVVESICKRRGLDVEKVKRYGLEKGVKLESAIPA
jgi:radical SAM superfamily enzyme YgiQ (UPF0313 family)